MTMTTHKYNMVAPPLDHTTDIERQHNVAVYAAQARKELRRAQRLAKAHMTTVKPFFYSGPHRALLGQVNEYFDARQHLDFLPRK